MKTLTKAIELAGGQSAAAVICSRFSGKNIKQGDVWYWIHKKNNGQQNL